MKTFPSGRMTPEQAAALARADRNKLVVMSVLALAVAFSFLYVRRTQGKQVQDATSELDGVLGTDMPIAETISIPEFDQRQLLEGIRDGRADDRVLEDSAALDASFQYARLLNWRHYEALAIANLDEAARAELDLKYAELRLKPYRARGWITSLQERERKRNVPEWSGSMRLEDGQAAHFVVQEVPREIAIGGFVKLEGLFFKLYRSEVAGHWQEGPLLLGAALEPSVPAEPPSEGLDAILAQVRDDTLDDISGEPTQAMWELMRLASVPQSEEFWQEAEELNSELLNKIFQDGEEFRGKAFRFPVCINVGTWVRRAEENPTRVDALTEGWMGNMFWKGHAKAVWFKLPESKRDLEAFQNSAHFVTARGYFLKNRIYDTRTGRPERVPFFVMEDVSIFTPVKDKSSEKLMAIFAGFVALLIGLIFFLLFRDRRKTRELQNELVRRRRARRGGLDLAGSTASGSA